MPSRIESHYIYVLTDYRNPSRVRYVGCTTDVARRLREHTKAGFRSAVGKWALSVGGGIEARIVRCIENKGWALEFEWLTIQALHARGEADLNGPTPAPWTLHDFLAVVASPDRSLDERMRGWVA